MLCDEWVGGGVVMDYDEVVGGEILVGKDFV